MEILEQLENEIKELKQKRNELEDELLKVNKELKQKTKASYVLKGMKIPPYFKKGRKKKEENVKEIL